MSERKTAEVKFRCTPTFKASLAADADAAGQSMSEYIESSVSARRSARRADEVVGGAIEVAQWAAENAKLDGTVLIDNAIASLRPECSPGGKAICTFAECNGGTTCSPRQDGAVTAAELRAAGHPNPELGEGLSTLGFETRPGHTWVNPGHTWVNPGLQPLDAPGDDVAPCGCRPYEFCTHKAGA